MDNQNFVVFGKPGSGKSTYLKNEILRDIQDRRAVFYLDPHGEDCLDLLDAIPRNRIRDVCYLDASDPTHAVGFNTLDAPHRLVSALRTIFKDSWGPRLEQFLRNGLAALHEANLTIEDLSPLYYDKAHRSKVLKSISKPSTKEFWTRLYPKAFNERQQQEAASPIYNKLDAILASDIARHLTQKHPKLDLRDAIKNRKIVIVNLASPVIGEDAATVLGSLFATTFRNTLMSHPGPASFFADEFQVYGTDVYISMLRELRKFGLKVGLATQFTQGIDPALLSAILGTVRDTIVFTVSYEDAQKLSAPLGTIMQDFTIDLANLPPFTAYVNDRRVSMPPFDPKRGSLKAVIEQSRRRYGRSMVPPPARPQVQKLL
jgi:DNA helicase HerA-like ATPase